MKTLTIGNRVFTLEECNNRFPNVFIGNNFFFTEDLPPYTDMEVYYKNGDIDSILIGSSYFESHHEFKEYNGSILFNKYFNKLTSK